MVEVDAVVPLQVCAKLVLVVERVDEEA